MCTYSRVCVQLCGRGQKISVSGKRCVCGQASVMGVSMHISE